MSPEELSTEVDRFIRDARSRIVGVGADQYHTEGEPQRFETLDLDHLFEYVREALLDLANYAVMLGIRVERLRAIVRAQTGDPAR